MRIILQPFEDADQKICRRLAEDLGSLDFTVDIARAIAIPAEAYNLKQRQYCAEQFLAAVGRRPAQWILGITECDLYVKPLNFVFGLAESPGRAAVISLYRLHDGVDECRYRNRTVKEAVHELGHTMGLGHCPDPDCVMYFSNSLLDTDRKGKFFCPLCRNTLPKGHAKHHEQLTAK